MSRVLAWIDPSITERFLAQQPGVIIARVRWEQSDLVASVVIDEPTGDDSLRLRRACLEGLGVHLTPRRLDVHCGLHLAA